MCAFFLKRLWFGEVVAVTQPLSINGYVSGSMEFQKPGNSPRPGPEIVETEVAKSDWREESVVGQCRMRWEVSMVKWPQVLHEGLSILERQEFKTGCVRCSEDERGHNECDEEARIS